MAEIPRKTKTRWLTEDWLARRDGYVAGLEPDKTYQVREASEALGVLEGTLVDHFRRHGKHEFKTGEGVSGRDLAIVLLRFALPATVAAAVKERRDPRPRKEVPAKPEPSPQVRGALAAVLGVLEGLAPDEAREVAFVVARRFSRSPGDE